MFPEEFIRRLEIQKYIEPGSLVDSLKDPSPVSILINPAKWNFVPDNSTPVPWCDNGFYLDEKPSFTLDPLFHAGCYYPREASGMILGKVLLEVMPVRDNIRALDLCASPGGKSIQLSGHLSGKNCLLVANEVIRQRASILNETITKWGCPNTLVTSNDPSAFGRLEGYFDLIVADVPCSGEGMFRSSIAVEQWSEENANHCSVRQKRIISDVWPSLKPGGILIYSTCTFNPEENEKNISWLISNYEAENIEIDVKQYDGITEIDHNGIKGYGFYPDKVKGEGFFISVVRKKTGEDFKGAYGKKNKEMYPSGKDLIALKSWIDIPDEKIIRKADDLFALPCTVEEYNLLTGNLNILKQGIHVATVKGNDCLPTHDLIMSGLLKEAAFPVYEANYETAIKFLRKDVITTGKLTDGWNIITYRNRNLGLIKYIGTRINNYYPVQWRIRMELTGIGEKRIINWKNDDPGFPGIH